MAADTRRTPGQPPRRPGRRLLLVLLVSAAGLLTGIAFLIAFSRDADRTEATGTAVPATVESAHHGAGRTLGYEWISYRYTDHTYRPFFVCGSSCHNTGDSMVVHITADHPQRAVTEDGLASFGVRDGFAWAVIAVASVCLIGVADRAWASRRTARRARPVPTGRRTEWRWPSADEIRTSPTFAMLVFGLGSAIVAVTFLPEPGPPVEGWVALALAVVLLGGATVRIALFVRRWRRTARGQRTGVTRRQRQGF
jgi:hypothetical protein